MAQKTDETLKTALRKTAVISCLYYLWDSVRVVTVVFAFIFLLFTGVVVAPMLAVAKWVYNVYCKYYDWLFDWYVSQDSL
jgi:hypothetical protein